MKGPEDNAAVLQRRLGNIEAFYHYLHEGLGGADAVLCCSSTIAGPLDVKVVKSACRHLWERHPLLRSRIVVKEADPYFLFDVPLRDIPVHSVFELGKTHIRTFMEREMDTRFDAAKCLWRVLLVTDKRHFNRHYLLLSLHHSIGDAASIVGLLQEMLAYCTKIIVRETIQVSPLPIGPAVDTAAHKEGPAEESSGSLAFQEYAPPERRVTRIDNIMAGPDRSGAFAARCREEDTTLHAALAAITLKTIQKQLGDHSVIIETPVDVRPDDGNGLGCRERTVSMGHDRMVQPAALWDVARGFADKVTSAPLAARDIPADPVAWVDEVRARRHFPLSCLFMYIGEIEPAEQGPYAIKNVSCASGRKGATQIMLVSAAGLGNNLSLTFAYTSPLISDTWAAKFVTDFMHVMDRAIK